jgi:hypothetical protein
MRALHEMGAMRVRVGAVDVTFAAPGLPADQREEDEERERDRRREEDDDDLYRSGG